MGMGIQISCFQTRAIETNVNELWNFKLEYDRHQSFYLSICLFLTKRTFLFKIYLRVGKWLSFMIFQEITEHRSLHKTHFCTRTVYIFCTKFNAGNFAELYDQRFCTFIWPTMRSYTTFYDQTTASKILATITPTWNWNTIVPISRAESKIEIK